MADASGTICKLDSKPDGAHHPENERLEDSFGSQRYGRSFVGTVRQISISPGGKTTDLTPVAPVAPVGTGH